ncbi:MAG TPA: hypothetical protein VFQ93_05430 [Casimicrobiaceae bacterium]|nr:hypothetical protein [Casimicrobiaceae bacterium]
MEARALSLSPTARADRFGSPQRRHLIALIVAALIAGLVFAAYSQPDLILGFSAFGLC